MNIWIQDALPLARNSKIDEILKKQIFQLEDLLAEEEDLILDL